MSEFRWQPYVPQAERRRQAAEMAAKLARKGIRLSPVRIEGRTIARTLWGKAWCTHLECYGDFENRLPRGRTYVRNGSVLDLQICKGRVNAIVQGSSRYEVAIVVEPMDAKAWERFRKCCAGSVTSAVDLLQGKLSEPVMAAVADPRTGLFPTPREIEFECSCPDAALMCKHVAAVLYGVGARLDAAPELFFTLRGVDYLELVAEAAKELRAPAATDFDAAALEDVFGIELEEAEEASPKRVEKKKIATSKVPRGKSVVVKAKRIKR